MRFIVMLGVAVGLASAAAMTPIERRQCSTQRDGCCLKQGKCQTCYFENEPVDCHCECLQYGLCPCTGYYGKTGECFSWYSPDGHEIAGKTTTPRTTTDNHVHGTTLTLTPGTPCLALWGGLGIASQPPYYTRIRENCFYIRQVRPLSSSTGRIRYQLTLVCTLGILHSNHIRFILSRAPIMKLSASLVSATLLSAQAAAGGLSINSESDIKSSAKTVAGNLLKYYKGNEKGGIPGILTPSPPGGDYYWWTGSVVWASLIDYWHFTGDSSHNDAVMQGLLFQTGDDANYMPKNQTASIANDDQGFWGIAAMTAAERKFPDPPRDKPQWLGLAQTVFENLAGRWDTQNCDGGLRWQIFSFNNGYSYKNSISTGALMHLGARLHRYTGNATYGDWADKAWAWAEEAGLVKAGAVFDGAHIEENCTDINKIEFSYGSSVYILGAAHMYNATSDSKWKDRLDAVLKHSLERFVKDDVVYEFACETVGTCTSDMTFLKGIFVQMLAGAAQVAPHIADTVLPVLRKNAAAVVKSCAGSGSACGFDWTEGKFDDKENAGSECNALSAIAPLLAKAGDAPYTAKTGGSSTGSTGSGSGSGGSGNSTSGDGNGSGNSGDKGGKGNGKTGAASKMGGSVGLGLVMACAAVLLL
ncbi:hypothetical protein PWT90_05639 [Aphanocladium album]|nr:hypothetical protein PWT90_05639 [Aphanocladium album]